MDSRGFAGGVCNVTASRGEAAGGGSGGGSDRLRRMLARALAVACFEQPDGQGGMRK